MLGIVMLVSNINSEPTIRVGIILSEDKYKQVRILIPELGPNKKSKNSISGNIDIKIHKQGLTANEQHFNEILLSSNEPNDHLTIYSVPTGRGFHWEKNIDVQLIGDIHIKNTGGYIELINQLPLEKYLSSVVTAEMSPDCPPAFIEAQTISARSWLLANRKVNHSDFDVCNDDCCQRYQGIVDTPDNTIRAIHNTFGKVITYGNDICNARYSKCCGGITESFENVWGGQPIPYLTSIIDHPEPKEHADKIDEHIRNLPESFCSPKFVPENGTGKYLGNVDSPDSYFLWNIEYSHDKLQTIFNDKLGLNVKRVCDLIPLVRGKSGRILKLEIKYIDNRNKECSTILKSEYEIRNALHDKFLYSSAFLMDIDKDKEKNIKTLKLSGAGWGHGVGLCQMGALGMALNGSSADEILSHYFKDTVLTKLY